MSARKLEIECEREITLSKGGTHERTLSVNQIQIPDLWHVAQAQDDPRCKEAILECWHLAHDLLNAFKDGE